MARILVIDDEENIRRSLKSALERRDHEIDTAATFKEGLQKVRGDFDLAFVDLMLPDGNGIDLLKEMMANHPERPVVMISGQADIETAVTAIKLGALDFIEKPLSLDRVLVTIDHALRTTRLRQEKRRLLSKAYGEFIGDSPAIKKLKENIALSAPKASHFLILGENGTGKELVANLIHGQGQFAEGPFVAVNCAALPADLVEAELFGHTKGAFTGASKARKGRFAEADGGSIFLDEIGEMPAAAQAKILRAIETRKITPVGSDRAMAVDGNIIAASNRDLQKRVTDGKFREDLLYRLNVVQFTIPPLRERPDDIAVLCRYFLDRFADESGSSPKSLTAEALSYIKKYRFPGNVRELKNLMERINIYCPSQEAGKSDIRPLLPSSEPKARVTLKEAVNRFEADFIKEAIARNEGNITRAAQQLGLERSHLYKKLKKNADD